MRNPLLDAKVAWVEEKISDYKARKLSLFMTSSFQTHSIPLLHMISKIDSKIPIYFLNTGFHFPETLTYKNQVSKLFSLHVRDLCSPIPKSQQFNPKNLFLYSSDPDYCCHMNKVLPLEPVLMKYDIWISGVRKQQSKTRGMFNFEEKGKHDSLRFHPILDWSNKEIYEYINRYNLPRHPLDSRGYVSIGCEPCTQKLALEETERDGRWSGLNKTECGLHTALIHKSS